MRIALLGLAAVIGATAVFSISRPTGSFTTLQDRYARLPLTFVENLGQTGDQVRFLAHGSRYGFYLTAGALVMSLSKPDGTTGVNLWLDFVGADPAVAVGAANKASGTVSYLRADASGRRFELRN